MAFQSLTKKALKAWTNGVMYESKAARRHLVIFSLASVKRSMVENTLQDFVPMEGLKGSRWVFRDSTAVGLMEVTLHVCDKVRSVEAASPFMDEILGAI